jgi:branched-chain amino acid transport system ATP-binding protein
MLKVVNLTKDFGGVRAVSNVSFEIKKGEILSIIGPNGAGKTTLFNMLTGLIKPTKGSIFFKEKEIIPEDSENDLKKLKIVSVASGIYSLLVTLYFYLMYYKEATFPFEYTIFLLSVLLIRFYSSFKLKQRVLWAKGFLSIILFFDVAAALFFVFYKHSIIPAFVIFFVATYFYLYFISRNTKNLFGEFVAADEIASMGIARTFQNIRLFQQLKAIENVKIGFHNSMKSGMLNIIFKTKKQRTEEEEFNGRALELLKFVGIEHHSENLASNLPYGEQRKLEIARALATNPDILLLDEPAAGMNPAETQELLKLIEKIRDSGITVVLIEHDMKIVMSISHRIVVLDYGVKIAEGLPEEIKNNKRVIEAYLGESNE